jgi:hypothetical protein
MTKRERGKESAAIDEKRELGAKYDDRKKRGLSSNVFFSQIMHFLCSLEKHLQLHHVESL